MKEYNSILLEDEEAQTLLDISLLTDKPVRSIPFPGDINIAIKDLDLGSRETYWYENHHIIGLHFDESEIKEIPESIGNLSYLRFLEIHTCKIQTLPVLFKRLHNLEHLVFFYEPYEFDLVNIDFPDIFSSLKNLKVFHIYGAFNIYLPPTFIELENLEELCLSYCNFSTKRSNFLLNYDVKDYESLQPVYDLPDDLGNLKSLRKITLRSLDIEHLPKSMVNLTSLIELDLNHSDQIKNIEIVFGITSLECLNLYYCEIESLPKSISNLTNLKTLNLAHNILQEIPSELKSCQKLEKIDLTWNSFEKELSVLTDLPSLKNIFFDKAYPEIIPKKLMEKKELEIKGF